MRDLTEFINAGEIGRDNLPIEDKPKIKELAGYKSKNIISETQFGQFDDRVTTGTKDQSFFFNEDRENKIALSQSTGELWGKGLWNTAVEATVGTLEGAAMLPGIDWTLKQIGGSDTGYGNFISEAINDVKEGMKSDVYETIDSRSGFAPWDGTWWAANSETLGTTLALMVPAMGATAAIGKLGKLSKAFAMRKSAGLTNAIANNANLVNKVENASKVLGQATISRWTENTMEAQGTFDDTYNTLLSQGLSQEAAKEQAGIAASRAWNANWLNLAQDVVQFNTIGKTVGKFSSRSMKTLAENAKSKPRQVVDFLGGMASESLEEADQYMIGQEAKRSVTDNEYKFSDVFNRVIDDYAKDPQLHTSMFFGALGGGVFQGVGDLIQNRLDKRIQKDIEDNKQKVNAILNDDYVKDANIDISLVFNKAMAYADMGVIDDLKDSVNKELTKTKEEHIADGKKEEEIEDYKAKLNDVIADIDFISDVRAKADNGYKSPMAVRLQVASEYTLRTYGKKLNGVKSEYAKLSSDSLAADGTIETLGRLKDIDTLESLKIFRTQIAVPKADGSTPVRNLEEVTSFIDERIKTIEKEIQAKLPEGTTMESYLKRDKNTAIANQDAFRNNIAAQEEFVIAMEDARLELEIAKGDKVDILTKRAKQTQLNQLKDKINKGELTLAEMNKAVTDINEPSFTAFLDEKLKNEELSAIPTGTNRTTSINKRYKGNNLLLAKELKELNALDAETFDIDSVEAFTKKYNSNDTFKKIVDKYYDNKAKIKGTFYDTTELKYENDTTQENTSADINSVTSPATSGDRLMNSLQVALVKKIDDNNVVFFGIAGSPQMSISEFEKIYSKQYLWTEFTPLYRLDGSIVYSDFNTFTDTSGNVVTVVNEEAQSMLNDPSMDLRGKNTRYRVYPNHPDFNPTKSPAGFLVGIEVEISKDNWLTMGRMSIGKGNSKLIAIREAILKKHKESGSDVIDFGNIVTGKRNGFIVRKPKVGDKDNKNPVSSIAKKDDVLAVIVPLENSSIDLVYGKLSEAKIVEMRNTVASTKLAQYAGNVVLMKKQADGTYTPTKLNTKKLKEVDLGNGKTLYNNVETLLENFEKLGGNHTQEQLDKLHTDLHKLTFLVLNRNADGKYQFVISTQVREQWSEPVTFEELKSYVKENKAVRIDKTRINDARYHKTFIDKYNILTTDIVPDNQLVGASIAIDIDKIIPLTNEEVADTKVKEKTPIQQKIDELATFGDDTDESIERFVMPNLSLDDVEERDEDSPITFEEKPKVSDIKSDTDKDIEALGFNNSLPSKLPYKVGKIYNTQQKEIFAGIVNGEVYINKELIDKYSNKEILENQAPQLNTILKNLGVYDKLVDLPKEQFINFLVAHEQAHLDFEKEGKTFKTEAIEEAYVNAKALIEVGILKLKSFDLGNTNEAVERLEKYFPTKEKYIDNITELVAKEMDNVTVSLSTMTGYKVNVFEGALWGKKLETSSMDDFYFLQGKEGYPKNKKELKEAISKDIARNIPQSIKKKYWKDILESLPDDEKALLSNWAYYNDYKRYTKQYGKPTFEFNEMPYPDLHKKGEKKYTNWTSFIDGLFTAFDGPSSDLWFANPLLSDTENSIINWYKNLTPEKLDEYISNLSRVMAFKSMVVASFAGGSNISALDSGARKIEDLQKAYYEIKQRTEISSTSVKEGVKRGSMISFQLEEYQVERVTENSIDVRNTKTGDTDVISKEDYDAELAALGKPSINNIPTEEEGYTFDDDDRYRVKEGVEDLTPITESEKEWFTKNYPNTDIQVFKDLSTIQKKGGPEAFGMFSNGLIYLTSDAPIGTIYHEAFHMVLHTMLSDKELKDLLAQQRYVRANKLKKNATDEEVEESLTYEFQDMMLTNGEIITTFTGKIKDFFKRLWNLIEIILERGGIKEGPSIKTMFYRVNRGLYNSFPKYKRNVTRFRKGVYGDLSVTEAKMASKVIANLISNVIVGTGEGKNLRTFYNMPDAETVDILKKANKLANPKYVRKKNEKDLIGYTFNDLVYEAYKKLNVRSQKVGITENEKNSIIRVMNALLYVDETGKKYVKNLKNLVVGEMAAYGIKIDVSNLNETVSNYISEDEDGVPDNQTDESFDYKDRFTSSLKDFRARSRQLFASIPNTNKTFATFKLFHDSSTVYNTIKKALEGSLDYQDMLNRLDKLYGNHPDYEILQERFISDPTLLTEFYNNFAQRVNTPFIKVITNGDGTKTVLESNKANVTSDIRADWFENFLNETNYIDSDTGQISDIGKEKAIANLELITKIVEDNKTNLKLSSKDAYAVISLIGETGILMDMDIIHKALTTKSLYSGRYKADNILIGNQFGKGLDYFYKLIIDGINPFQVSDSDTEELGSSITINKMLDGVSYQMSTLFPELRSTIFQNGKNKSVDSNLLPRDSARRLQRFKDSSENHNGFLLDQMKADPFWKDSEFLEQFHVHAKEIKLSILDTSEVDKGDHREYSEFTSKNFHTSMMNLFFNYSKNRTIEIEAKQVVVPGKENLKYGWYGMPIPSNSTAYNLIRFAKYDTETAIELIVDAVRNEKNRIEELEKLISANQEVYDTWKAGNKRTRKITKPEVFKHIPFNMLLNGRKYHVFSELNNGDKAIVFADDNAFEVAVKDAYRNYNARVFQEYINKDIIEVGSNGYVIKDENLDNRIATTKREISMTNEVYQRNNNSALKRNLNRYNANATLMNIQMAFFFAGDIANYSYDENTNSASIEDFFKRVKQINSPGTYLDINAKFKTDTGKELSVRKKYKAAIVQDQDLIVSQQLNDIVDIETKYVTTLGYNQKEIEHHIEFITAKYSKMNITDAYTMIDIFRYREIALGAGKWNNAKEALYDKVMNDEYISPNEMEILQPFKPFRYSIEIVEGKEIPTQHKNAEMLIIPQMAKYNSVNKTALEKMGYAFTGDSFTFDEVGRQENKYIDALMYNSSVKVGELYTFATEEAINPDEVQLFDNDDYRIQMGTPEHFYDSEINFGSQLRKLIIEGFDVNDSKTIYNIDGEQLTAKQIIDRYNEILTANLAESYQDVRSIFTNDKGEIDTKKMVEELKKYIIKRELGNDYLEAVELIDGKPTIPYWYPTISYHLQAIFSAFYKNNITKQTATGMALFNSSSVGYNETGIIRKPKIKFNTDSNGETYIEHIEALIPMNSKHLLKFVDKTTGLIDVDKVEKFDPKLLKALFYRIPSEDKYSLAHIKVIGFIPNIMGAQIILPDEITTMAGLDFDIDKMFGMAYEIDNTTGKTIPSGMDSKGARNNRLLDLMYGIMQLPQTAGRQLSPGNFENLTKVKTDVLELTKTDTSLNFASLISKAEVQQRNMTGNELIGTFANHRVNHVIFTLADFNFTESIDFDGYSLYSLSETVSPIDKRDIGLRLATFVAAVVDNAKDPIAAMINLAPFLSDVAASMIRVGYSEDLVGIFLSQKTFVKLTQEYSNSSDYGKSNVIRLLSKLQNDLVISDEQIDEAKQIIITTKLLEKNIQEPNPLVDYALINQMIKLVNQADTLRKIMSTMRFDSTAKAAGPTYFETEAKILEYENVIDNDKVITGYKEFMNNDSLQWVRDFYQLGIVKAQEEMLSIMELPYNKSVFKDARDYFSRWKLDGSLRPNELETIARAVMTVNASSFEPFNHKKSLEIITNFPETFQKVKNKSIRYSALTGLITVEQAKSSSTRYSIPFKTLKFNKLGVSPSHMQTIREVWSEMMESDDVKVRNFAHELAAYSFFTSGFLFKKNSIAEGIPISWMTQITYNGKTFLQHMKEKNESSYLSQIQKEEIVRNLYQSLDIFATVKEKDNGVEVTKGVDSIYTASIDMNVEANKFYKDDPINNEIVKTYSPYIRLSLNNDVRLLKLDSFNRKENTAVYKEIQPLGIHNRYVQFSDGSDTIKGVISIGTSTKKQEVINRINSFNTVQSLTEAWNSPKFSAAQKELYKSDFTNRKLKLTNSVQIKEQLINKEIKSNELLIVEENEIPKKDGESFEEMQQRVTQNLNIRKRIEIAQKNTIIQGKSYSFSEIKKIFNNEKLFENEIYKQLDNILQSSNLAFKFGSLNKGKKSINAYYDSINNSINIDTLVLQTPNLATSDFKRILLHEIIHAATFINLKENANLTNTQKTALNNLNNLIEELKKDRDFFAQYGLTNANELLAELANEQFVDKLKKKTFSNNQSFFDKIISEIVKLLGLKTTAYDIVKESFDNLVSEKLQNINQSTEIKLKIDNQEQSVIKEEISNDIGNMMKEDNQFESLQYAIGTYLTDKNDTSKTTITEDVNSFEEYSKNPVNVSKESWERMTREEQLANWYAEQKCR
jgi:hypothetical protein